MLDPPTSHEMVPTSQSATTTLGPELPPINQEAPNSDRYQLSACMYLLRPNLTWHVALERLAAVSKEQVTQL